jgi:hypothetical protein
MVLFDMDISNSITLATRKSPYNGVRLCFADAVIFDEEKGSMITYDNSTNKILTILVISYSTCRIITPKIK